MPGRKASPKHGATALRKRTAKVRNRSDHALELIDLVVEAAKSRELPAFLDAFAGRAGEMLEAEWGALGEIRGNKVELHCLETSRRHLTEYQDLLMENVMSRRAGLEVLPGKRQSTYVAFYPIYASDGELMGTLCLLRETAEFSAPEEKLLAALGSHATLVMEKVRRFSQLERSKKQWVEDIDAISDYILVHDQGWRIVRTNRSLATHLGIPPVALVGEPMSSLKHVAETGSALPCPLCRNTNQSREEYIATGEGRTYLVSTSRTQGATEEEGRTIHVLKDITDRREAERRSVISFRT